MVLREGDGLAGTAEHAARVAGIGYVILLGGHEHYVGSATSMAGDLLVLRVAALFVEFPRARLTDDELIHELEGFDEGLSVVGRLIGSKAGQLIEEFALHELTNLVSWVNVGVPPWPSKTAKSELPSPSSTS